MERYLDGQELSEEEVATALKKAVARGEVFPVAAAVATKNLGTTALLDLLVEGVPARMSATRRSRSRARTSPRSCSRRSPIRSPGRINVFRVLKGTITTDTTLTDTREHAKERMGTLMTMQGKDHARGRRVRRGRHRRGREAEGREDRRRADRQGGRLRGSDASTSPSR